MGVVIISVQINKNGVIITSGDSQINPNLIAGEFNCYSTNSTHSQQGSASTPNISAILMANKGKTMWFSYDYSVEGTKKDTSSDWSKNRYGVHLSLNYSTSSSSSNQAYPCADYLNVTGTGRAIQSFTIPTTMTAVNSFGASIQVFNRPADGNTATWYLKNLKLEIGEYPTPWIPHETDSDYVGTQHGFLVMDEIFAEKLRINSGRIQAIDFIEI